MGGFSLPFRAERYSDDLFSSSGVALAAMRRTPSNFLRQEWRIIRVFLRMFSALASTASCSSAGLTRASPALAAVPQSDTVRFEVLEVQPRFRGTALVIFAQTGGQRGTRDGNALIHRVPSTGTLRISDPVPTTTRLMFVREAGSRRVLSIAPVYAWTENAGASSATAPEGCWLPQVEMSGPPPPAYAAFLIAPPEIWPACVKFGIAAIDFLIFREGTHIHSGPSYAGCAARIGPRK